MKRLLPLPGKVIQFIIIHGSVLQSLKQPWEATLIVSEMLD